MKKIKSNHTEMMLFRPSNYMAIRHFISQKNNAGSQFTGQPGNCLTFKSDVQCSSN